MLIKEIFLVSEAEYDQSFICLLVEAACSGGYHWQVSLGNEFEERGNLD